MCPPPFSKMKDWQKTDVTEVLLNRLQGTGVRKMLLSQWELGHAWDTRNSLAIEKMPDMLYNKRNIVMWQR